jgi:hypothetical protein
MIRSLVVSLSPLLFLANLLSLLLILMAALLAVEVP